MAGSSRKDLECITSGYPLRDYQVFLGCRFGTSKININTSLDQVVFVTDSSKVALVAHSGADLEKLWENLTFRSNSEN